MIKFIEDKHQYLSLQENDTLPWTSVTQLIHQYQPKKNWDMIAKRYAKKHNLSVEDVKLKWKAENEKAVNRGVKFHKQREQDLLSCETIGLDGNALPICHPVIDEAGNKISPPQKLQDGVYPELLVLLNSAHICGQADYVMISNGLIHIKDYKTNKEIKEHGFVNWEGIEERMLDPITGIPNSNYWHYALQLNIYAYIIRKNNPLLKVGKLELLHIQFDETEEVSNITPYELPDLQDDVHRLITHFKNRYR